jgi:predicted RNA binding protein YcfA (HicA-like mRNA interferase family)
VGNHHISDKGTVYLDRANSNAVKMNKRKLLEKIRRGECRNIHFGDMRALINGFGFNEDRREGSHVIFVHPSVKEFLNLQEVDGQVKPYQVKQFIKLVDQYKLELKD